MTIASAITEALGQTVPKRDRATGLQRDSGEADLIERAKADPAEFDLLYRTHYRTIASYLFRRTGDAHAAVFFIVQLTSLWRSVL